MNKSQTAVRNGFRPIKKNQFDEMRSVWTLITGLNEVSSTAFVYRSVTRLNLRFHSVLHTGAAFRVMKPCSLISGYQHTEEICCLHLHGQGGIQHQGLTSVILFCQKWIAEQFSIFWSTFAQKVFWMKRQICNCHKVEKKAPVM
jgi:hypothetical protein